jgi:monoamine oxidase
MGFPMSPGHIAVLGGGLTGLSAAFHLSRRFPGSQITLLERERTLGGWVRSERVELPDDPRTLGTVVLEAGPRTLRPNAESVLELVRFDSCCFLVESFVVDSSKGHATLATLSLSFSHLDCY